MLFLPKEIMTLILEKIDQPRTFFNMLQVSKEIFLLAKPLVPTKRVLFLKFTETEYESYYTLPNGKYEGPFLVFNDGKNDILTETNYLNGQKHGQETIYCAVSTHDGSYKL